MLCFSFRLSLYKDCKGLLHLHNSLYIVFFMCFASRGFTSHFKTYYLNPQDAHDITRKDDAMFVGHFFVGKGIKRHSQVLNVQRGGGSYTQAADYWRQRSCFSAWFLVTTWFGNHIYYEAEVKVVNDQLLRKSDKKWCQVPCTVPCCQPGCGTLRDVGWAVSLWWQSDALGGECNCSAEIVSCFCGEGWHIWAQCQRKYLVERNWTQFISALFVIVLFMSDYGKVLALAV